MTPCKRCGNRLLFSARMSGTGHCGPCRRANRFSLKRWLVKQWHRFTLGRTARYVETWGSMQPGTRGAIVMVLAEAAARSIPVGIVFEIKLREATDLSRGQVRIVLETCE